MNKGEPLLVCSGFPSIIRALFPRPLGPGYTAATSLEQVPSYELSSTQRDDYGQMDKQADGIAACIYSWENRTRVRWKGEGNHAKKACRYEMKVVKIRTRKASWSCASTLPTNADI